MSSVILNGDTSGSVSISPPAVAGTQTVTLPAASGQLMVSGNMPAFYAYVNSAQTLSSNTWTKLQLNAEVFDTANCFDSTTNYRFTPNVAGYYQFNCQLTSASSTCAQLIALYKNGSSYIRLNNLVVNTESISGSWMLYLNGTTDYVEMYGNFSTGQGVNTGLGVEQTSMQGFLVRTA